ncbi:MAG: VWA domain-containing protein [Candidatus Heimdallarchaeota archaeon]
MPKSKSKKNFKKNDTEPNPRESKLISFAKTAWEKASRDFYFPPLNEPRFVFDYTHLEGFYIDPENKWQITMNLAQTPLFTEDREYINYFYAISLHEISHYQIIPYDGLINAKLLRAAMKYVSQSFAPIIVNVFSDLIIDTKLYKKFPNLILWELQKTYQYIINKNGNNLSKFSKFLFLSYEKLMNVKILKEDSPSEIENVAKRVANLVLKDFEDETKWEDKVTKVAYHLKVLINNTFSLVGTGNNQRNGKTKRKAPGKERSEIEFPEDILEIMDNPLENKNSDKLRRDNEDELKQKAEEFAKSTPYSEFGAPAGQAGILIDGNPLATWYRGLAQNLIEIKIFEERPIGNLPIYPEVWRIGEPIDELDLVQTVLTSPIIIPNVTTRKWSKKESLGHLKEQEIPDLLIVIDSSGSMNWNYTLKNAKGPYHIALVASFAALHYASKKGVKFSIINFSNQADICDWTYNYQKAERVLLKYQGGGTHLPTKSILKQCEKAERKALIFIITDFGIYNWAGTKKSLLILANKGHKIVGFFIGSSKIPKQKFKDLIQKVSFYSIKNVNDLIDLVIKEVKKYYQ